MDFTEAWDDTCSRIGLAARIGDVKLLKKLIKDGLPVDAEDNRGWKPLHEAAAKNHVACVKQLLSTRQTDVNWRTYEGHSALLLACRSGHVETVRILLQAGADPDGCDGDMTSLIAAVSCKSIKCVELLMDKNANVNLANLDSWTPLHEAAQQGIVEALVILLDRNAEVDARDDNGRTPLFIAAEHGQLQALQFLCDSGKMKVNVNNVTATDGTTPLIIASQGGHADCVRFLLDNGSQVDSCTKDGITAVHLAAFKGNMEVLQILLQHCNAETIEKIDNCEASYGTPLHIAAAANRKKALALLIEKGFRIDSAAEDLEIENEINNLTLPTRITPLGKAAKCSAVDCMHVLLNAGANPNTSAGNTVAPLTAALLGRNEMTVRLLLDSGSSVNYHGSYCRHPEALLIGVNMSSFELLLKAGGDVSSLINEETTNVLEWLVPNSRIEPDAIKEKLELLMKYVVEWNSVASRIGKEEPSLLCVTHQLRRSSPSSLVHLSRLTVRQILTSCGKCNLLQSVKQLAIPPCLQEYLVYNYCKI